MSSRAVVGHAANPLLDEVRASLSFVRRHEALNAPLREPAPRSSAPGLPLRVDQLRSSHSTPLTSAPAPMLAPAPAPAPAPTFASRSPATGASAAVDAHAHENGDAGAEAAAPFRHSYSAPVSPAFGLSSIATQSTFNGNRASRSPVPPSHSSAAGSLGMYDFPSSPAMASAGRAASVASPRSSRPLSPAASLKSAPNTGSRLQVVSGSGAGRLDSSGKMTLSNVDRQNAQDLLEEVKRQQAVLADAKAAFEAEQAEREHDLHLQLTSIEVQREALRAERSEFNRQKHLTTPKSKRKSHSHGADGTTESQKPPWTPQGGRDVGKLLRVGQGAVEQPTGTHRLANASAGIAGAATRTTTSTLALVGPTRESGLVTEAHALRRARERTERDNERLQDEYVKKMLAIDALRKQNARRAAELDRQSEELAKDKAEFVELNHKNLQRIEQAHMQLEITQKDIARRQQKLEKSIAEFEVDKRNTMRAAKDELVGYIHSISTTAAGERRALEVLTRAVEGGLHDVRRLELDKFEEELLARDRELQLQESDLASRMAAASTKEAQVNELLNQVEALRATRDGLEAEIGTIKLEALRDVNAMREELEATHQAKMKEVGEREAMVTEKEAALTDAESKLQAAAEAELRLREHQEAFEARMEQIQLAEGEASERVTASEQQAAALINEQRESLVREREVIDALRASVARQQEALESTSKQLAEERKHLQEREVELASEKDHVRQEREAAAKDRDEAHLESQRIVREREALVREQDETALHREDIARELTALKQAKESLHAAKGELDAEKEAAAMAASDVARQQRDLDRHRRRLAEDMESLSEKRAALNAEADRVAALKAEVAQHRRELEKAQSEYRANAAGLDGKVAHYDSELASLQAEKAKLRALEVSAARKAADADERHDAANRLLAELEGRQQALRERERAILDRERAARVGESEAAAATNSQLERLTATLSDATTRLAEAKSAEVAAHDRVQKLDAELVTVRGELSTAQTTIDQLKATISQLESSKADADLHTADLSAECGQLQLKISALQREVDHFRAAADELSATDSRKDQDLRSIMSAKLEAEEQAAAHSGQVSALTEQLEAATAEQAKLREQLDDANQTIASLEARAARSAESFEVLNLKLEHTLEEKEYALSSQRNAERTSNDQAATIEALRAEVVDLQRALRDKEADVFKLEDSLRTATADANDTASVAAETAGRVKRLEEWVEELQAANTALETQLDQEKSSKLSAVEDAEKRAADTQQSLRADLAALTQQVAASSSVSEQLEAERARSEGLQSELSDSAEALKQSNAEAENLKADIERLMSQISELNSRIAALESENKAAQAALLASTEQKDAVLADRLRDLEEQALKHGADLEQVTQEREDLQTKLEHSKSSITDLRSELSETCSTVSKLQAEIQAVEEEKAELQHEIAALRAQSNKVVLQVACQTSNSDDLDAKVRSLEQTCNNLEAQLADKGLELSAVQADAQSLRDAVARLKDENEDLNSQVTQLEQRADSEQALAREQRLELERVTADFESLQSANQVDVDSLESTQKELVDELASTRSRLEAVTAERDGLSSSVESLKSRDQDAKQSAALRLLQSCVSRRQQSALSSSWSSWMLHTVRSKPSMASDGRSSEVNVAGGAGVEKVTDPSDLTPGARAILKRVFLQARRVELLSAWAAWASYDRRYYKELEDEYEKMLNEADRRHAKEQEALKEALAYCQARLDSQLKLQAAQTGDGGGTAAGGGTGPLTEDPPSSLLDREASAGGLVDPTGDAMAIRCTLCGKSFSMDDIGDHSTICSAVPTVVGSKTGDFSDDDDDGEDSVDSALAATSDLDVVLDSSAHSSINGIRAAPGRQLTEALVVSSDMISVSSILVMRILLQNTHSLSRLFTWFSKGGVMTYPKFLEFAMAFAIVPRLCPESQLTQVFRLVNYSEAHGRESEAGTFDSEEFNEALTRLGVFYAPGTFDFSDPEEVARSVEVLLLWLNEMRPEGLPEDIRFTENKKRRGSGRRSQLLITCHMCGVKVPMSSLQLHTQSCSGVPPEPGSTLSIDQKEDQTVGAAAGSAAGGAPATGDAPATSTLESTPAASASTPTSLEDELRQDIARMKEATAEAKTSAAALREARIASPPRHPARPTGASATSTQVQDNPAVASPSTPDTPSQTEGSRSRRSSRSGGKKRKSKKYLW